MKSLYSALQDVKNISSLAALSPIKSIQRGTVNAAVAGTNVTISAVDMSKTSVRIASGRAANDNITLTNETTINCKSSVAGNVDWEVVEWR